jgi:hypothetical protein
LEGKLMLATVIVLSLVVVAFWRSAIKFLIAAILALLLVGGIQAAQFIGTITVSPQPTECSPNDNC